MPFLIAVAGWSGVGKTTAVDHLKNVGAGEKIYLGETVLNEIRLRGLLPGPTSEQLVRRDLRAQHAPVSVLGMIGHCQLLRGMTIN
jgi:dephospho-CoA kinase